MKKKYVKPESTIIKLDIEQMLTKHSGRGKSNEHTNDPHNNDPIYDWPPNKHHHNWYDEDNDYWESMSKF